MTEWIISASEENKINWLLEFKMYERMRAWVSDLPGEEGSILWVVKFTWVDGEKNVIEWINQDIEWIEYLRKINWKKVQVEYQSAWKGKINEKHRENRRIAILMGEIGIEI